MCILIFSIYLSGTFLDFENNWARCDKKVYLSVCKVSVIIVRFQLNLYFLDNFWKILKYKISRKSAKWNTSCSVRTDGRKGTRTDMAKLKAAFRSYANAPKSVYCERNVRYSSDMCLCCKIQPNTGCSKTRIYFIVKEEDLLLQFHLRDFTFWRIRI